MSQPRILVVTLPNDLGSRTIETNLIKLLGYKCDLRVFRFAADTAETIDHKIDSRQHLKLRILNTLKLRKAVRTAVLEGRKVLFYNVSPAMFSFGSWRRGKVYITMDWAGRLFSPEPLGFRTLVAWLNRMIFHSCDGLLPMTQAMANCLARDYGVPQRLIHLVPSLFDVEHFDPGEIQSTDQIRVLFVGGDIKRKGGDLLFEAYQKKLKGRCILTMITNGDLPPCEGVTHRKGVRYGSEEHLGIMRNHDILVLPTLEDAGPQVIGEAAAAGLAILTTEAARGAPHVIRNGINGIISETPERCINSLFDLLDQPDRIKTMREASLYHMRTHYSKQMIASTYLNAMTD